MPVYGSDASVGAILSGLWGLVVSSAFPRFNIVVVSHELDGLLFVQNVHYSRVASGDELDAAFDAILGLFRDPTTDVWSDRPHPFRRATLTLLGI